MDEQLSELRGIKIFSIYHNGLLEEVLLHEWRKDYVFWGQQAFWQSLSERYFRRSEGLVIEIQKIHHLAEIENIAEFLNQFNEFKYEFPSLRHQLESLELSIHLDLKIAECFQHKQISWPSVRTVIRRFSEILKSFSNMLNSFEKIETLRLDFNLEYPFERLCLKDHNIRDHYHQMMATIEQNKTLKAIEFDLGKTLNYLIQEDIFSKWMMSSSLEKIFFIFRKQTAEMMNHIIKIVNQRRSPLRSLYYEIHDAHCLIEQIHPFQLNVIEFDLKITSLSNFKKPSSSMKAIHSFYRLIRQIFEDISKSPTIHQFSFKTDLPIDQKTIYPNGVTRRAIRDLLTPLLNPNQLLSISLFFDYYSWTPSQSNDKWILKKWSIAESLQMQKNVLSLLRKNMSGIFYNIIEPSKIEQLINETPVIQKQYHKIINQLKQIEKDHKNNIDSEITSLGTTHLSSWNILSPQHRMLEVALNIIQKPYLSLKASVQEYFSLFKKTSSIKIRTAQLIIFNLLEYRALINHRSFDPALKKMWIFCYRALIGSRLHDSSLRRVARNAPELLGRIDEYVGHDFRNEALLEYSPLIYSKRYFDSHQDSLQSSASHTKKTLR